MGTISQTQNMVEGATSFASEFFIRCFGGCGRREMRREDSHASESARSKLQEKCPCDKSVSSGICLEPKVKPECRMGSSFFGVPTKKQ
jgi:hypothetical protein